MSDLQQNKPEAAQQVGRGRPRDTEKNAAIAEAAGQLFLEKGFDGASMDEVAKRAGVSKQTVYSHFSNKEQLFSASIRAVIAEYIPDTVTKRVETHSLEADLRAVFEAYARLLLSADALAMHRLLVAGHAQGQTLAQLFWTSGPFEMQEKLESFLLSWVQKKELIIPDVSVACEQAVGLLKGKLHFMLEIGLVDTISEDQIQTNVDNALTAFLKLYRA